MNNRYKLILLIIIIVVVVVLLIRLRYKSIDSVRSKDTDRRLRNVNKLSSRNISGIHDGRIQRIPKVIMQTNEKNLIPIGMYKAIKSILRNNPEYEYVYFDNEASRIYLQEEYGSRYLRAYDNLIPGAYKADFFRYCFLYRTGGIYLDTGMVSKIPFRNIIKPDDEFISPEDNGCGGIYNAFMCCISGHPIMKAAVKQCLHNIEKCFMGDDILEITGPDMLSSIFEKVVGKDVNPNTDYGNGIRLLYYRSPESKRSKTVKYKGEVFCDGEICLYAKYPTYKDDMKWYNTSKHYSILWKRNQVYKSMVNSKLSSFLPDSIYIARYEINRYKLKHKKLNK